MDFELEVVIRSDNLPTSVDIGEKAGLGHGGTIDQLSDNLLEGLQISELPMKAKRK